MDAFGKTEVVIVSDTAIVSDRSCVAFAPALSSTCTVKLEVPVDGVPEIVPVLPSRLSPEGSVPVVTDQTKGAVPPLAVNVFEYSAAAVPPGRAVVVIFNTSPIEMESGRVVLAPTLSVTRIVKLTVPAAVGVPLMAPLLAFRFKPGGSAPAEMDQLVVPVPPVETTA